jgi:hypothetical protein
LIVLVVLRSILLATEPAQPNDHSSPRYLHDFVGIGTSRTVATCRAGSVRRCAKCGQHRLSLSGSTLARMRVGRRLGERRILVGAPRRNGARSQAAARVSFKPRNLDAELLSRKAGTEGIYLCRWRLRQLRCTPSPAPSTSRIVCASALAMGAVNGVIGRMGMHCASRSPRRG